MQFSQWYFIQAPFFSILCTDELWREKVHLSEDEVTMRSKRRHKAGGWLARLLPCHLRHRDSTLFKLTVLVCLVFPGYILLFNHFSNLGLLGEIRQGGDQAQETPGRTLHLEPVKSTQSTSLHQSRLKKDALLGDISQGKAVRGDGGNQDTSVVRQERDLHQGRGLVNYSQHKTQLISGIRGKRSISRSIKNVCFAHHFW